MQFRGVGRETRAESGEPEVAGGWLECGFQCNQDARTADIAIVAEDFPRVDKGASGDGDGMFQRRHASRRSEPRHVEDSLTCHF